MRRASPISQALLLSSVLLLAVACGETKVVCPAGSHYSGSGTICLADQPLDTGGGGSDEADTTEPADTATGKDGGDTGQVPETVQDTQGTDDAGGDASPDTKPDAKPDTKPDTSSKASVGAACADDYDCLSGLQCFGSWPKGYCTIVSCDAPGNNCPGSSVCYGEATLKLCHVACELDGDCRLGDGYACKRLSATFGGIDAQLCSPSGKNPAGLGCSKASDCAGSATCLTDMPGGYCARLGCGLSDPCDSGQACVLRNGKPVCLKTCVADVECQIGGNNPRKCVDKTDLGKQPVKVCLDSTTSAPVGAACLADLDCETKLCSIFAKGTCTVGGQPCMNDTQCGAAGPCKLDPAAEKGVCSAPCNKDKPCPINSVCVPGSDNTSGSCQPTCKGPGDEASCGGVPGLLCVYGKPLATIAGGAPPAQYACAPQPAGSAGAMCTKTADCTKALCLQNQGKTGGYCTPDCGALQYCPFGTACDNSGMAQCMRLCTSTYDCPSGFACSKLSGMTSSVCLPP